MPALTAIPRSSPAHTLTNRQSREINSHVRAWCVVHACDSAADAVQLVDGQQAVGMKPYLLAGDGSHTLPGRPTLAHPVHSGSLLTAWNEVRDWRKLLINPDMTAFDLVHAHAFPAGMAAVRNCPTVVYDIHNFVESKAGPRAGSEFTWLARSFRVAEQFVIARAGAVVVHSHSMRQGALDRGASRENLFQVPEPLDAHHPEGLSYKRAAIDEAADSAEGVTLFAPDACLRQQDDPSLLPLDAAQLLEAFAILSSELADARLIIQSDSECVQPLYEKASALGVAGRVHAVRSADRQRALAEADVVVALSSEHAETSVLAGLLNFRAILAADVSAARDASAEGTGVLWFRPGDMPDLARRAAFLGRNPDFRVALAQAGQRHLLETRTPEAVARRYDFIYRHAWERRRTGPASGMNLQPLTACF
jgi:glycosyltransferase involved in cell wall biosynthesis